MADTAPSDRELITQLVARFDDATNIRDADGFRTLWTHDAEWRIGEPRPMHAKGIDDIVSHWQGLLDRAEWFFRGSYAGVVDVDGDAGVGRWPCLEMSTVAHPEDPKRSGYDNRAVYEDRYVRRDGRWLFASRSYVYFWISDAPIPGQKVPMPNDRLSDEPSFAAKDRGLANG